MFCAFFDKGQNVLKDKKSSWPNIISLRSRCEGRSRVNLPQRDIPVPLHSLFEPDLLLAVCIQFWHLPRLNLHWRSNSTVFVVAPSLVDILYMAWLSIDQRLESDGTNHWWCPALYLIILMMSAGHHYLLEFTKAGQVFCSLMDVLSFQSSSVCERW